MTFDQAAALQTLISSAERTLGVPRALLPRKRLTAAIAVAREMLAEILIEDLPTPPRKESPTMPRVTLWIATAVAAVVLLIVTANGCGGGSVKLPPPSYDNGYRNGFEAGLNAAAAAYDHAIETHLRRDALELMHRQLFDRGRTITVEREDGPPVMAPVLPEVVIPDELDEAC